ncbi:uncharacterized protein TM35_001281030, partial [Trypanosoma theileri]
MILVRRPLYLMVVLLSVAFVVAGEAQQEPAELAEGAGVIPGVDGCKTQSTGPECPRVGSNPAIPLVECAESPQKEDCTPTTLTPTGNCDENSTTHCTPKATQELGSVKAGEDERNREHEHHAANGTIDPSSPRGSVSTLSNKDRAETGPDGTLGEQPPRDSQPGKETEPFPSPAAP